MIYLDYSATTPVALEVQDTMNKVTREFIGNANSLNGLGIKSRNLLNSATKQIANCFNILESEITYTSSSTESNNLAIIGCALAYFKKGKHIIVSKLEHADVYDICDYLKSIGFEISYVSSNADGLVDFEELKRLIRPDTILVSIAAVNSELGIRQPLKMIRQIIKKENPNTLFHSDMTQAVGKISVSLLDTDLATISSHKIYGPKGIGALYVKNGIDFQKFIDGGHQEKNRRAGTENVAGIAGLGKACELAKKNLPEHIKYLSELRDYFISEVEKRISNVKLNGERTNRLPGNTNFSFQNIEGEALLLNLDQYGICASSGSACTTGSNKPSHVLVAIGLPQEVAYSSLRITFGEDNTKEEVDYLLEKLEEIVRRLRKIATGSGFKWQ